MTESIAQKIKDVRAERDLSQDQLARQLSVTKKTIAEWEQSRQPPSPERCLQLARLAVPGELRRWFTQHALQRIGADGPLVLDALLGKRRRRLPQAPLPGAELRVIAAADLSDRFRALEGLDHFSPVPLLKDAAAAGSPQTVSDQDIEGYVLIPYAWCPSPESFTCVRVQGDSMAPILHNGALVAIDHGQRDPMTLHHKMVAVRYQGGVTLKWLERRAEMDWLLVPENKEYPSVELPRSPDNPIIGIVAWWWNRQV
jgi:SOS-response transcriptional repressor LexA